MAIVEQSSAKPEVGVIDTDNIIEFHAEEAAALFPIAESEAPKSRMTRFKQCVGRLALVTAVTLGSGTAGVALTDTPVQVGPHTAEAQLTFDNYATITSADHDSKTPTKGSSLSIPVDVPLGLGVHLSFKDLPVKISKHEVVPTKISKKDLRAYASLFADYEKDISRGEAALRHKFELFAALGDSALFGALMLGEALQRRRGAEKLFLPKIIHVALAAGIVCTAALPVIRDKSYRPPGASISAAYGSLPFNGVLVGGGLLEFIQENKQYYDQIEYNLKRQYAQRPQVFADKNIARAVVEEGDKCNTGMSRIIGVTAKLTHGFVISAGDDALGGTAFDSFCIDNLARNARGHLLKVRGNHDPIINTEQAKDQGITMLENRVVSVDGIRVAGIGDPFENLTFAGRTRQINNQTRATEADNLAVTACQDKNVSVAVTNQPEVGEKVLRQGCADLVIAGSFERSYSVSRAVNNKLVGHYLAKSAGGATYSSEPSFDTLGQPKVQMELTVFTFNKTSKQPLYFEVITISPDTSVSISAPTLMPYALTSHGKKALLGK